MRVRDGVNGRGGFVDKRVRGRMSKEKSDYQCERGIMRESGRDRVRGEARLRGECERDNEWGTQTTSKEETERETTYK